MDVIKALEWRYAVKLFDRERQVPQEAIDRLVEAVRLTPTSFGLQPFRLMVVDDPATKEALNAACYGQVQTGSSSHVFVLTCMTDFGVKSDYVDKFFSQHIEERNLDADAAEQFRSLVTRFLSSLSGEAKTAWEDKQAYIGLGNLMTVAAVEGIDACPMEGFVPSAVDEILGLAAKNMRPVLLCPVGYRHEDDYYQNYTKIRVSQGDFLSIA